MDINKTWMQENIFPTYKMQCNAMQCKRFCFHKTPHCILHTAQSASAQVPTVRQNTHILSYRTLHTNVNSKSVYLQEVRPFHSNCISNQISRRQRIDRWLSVNQMYTFGRLNFFPIFRCYLYTSPLPENLVRHSYYIFWNCESVFVCCLPCHLAFGNATSTQQQQRKKKKHTKPINHFYSLIRRAA